MADQPGDIVTRLEKLKAEKARLQKIAFDNRNAFIRQQVDLLQRKVAELKLNPIFAEGLRGAPTTTGIVQAAGPAAAAAPSAAAARPAGAPARNPAFANLKPGQRAVVAGGAFVEIVSVSVTQDDAYVAKDLNTGVMSIVTSGDIQTLGVPTATAAAKPTFDALLAEFGYNATYAQLVASAMAFPGTRELTAKDKLFAARAVSFPEFQAMQDAAVR